MIGRAGRQVVAEELVDLLVADRRRGGRSRPGRVAAPWRTRPAGNVGRVKHSANRAAAAGKSSRSVEALPNTVNRPALIASCPPIESKYSAICRAEWSAVPMSSIAPTSAARPAVVLAIDQRAAEDEGLDVDQRQLGCAASRARAARWAAARSGFRPPPPSRPSRPASARRPAGR